MNLKKGFSLSLLTLYAAFSVTNLMTSNFTFAAQLRGYLSYQKIRKLLLTCQENPFKYENFESKNKTPSFLSQITSQFAGQFKGQMMGQKAIGLSAEVEFNKTSQKNKMITTLLVQWTTPQRKSVVEGLTINDSVKWNGVTMQSAKFITSPKLSYELLYSLTDDIYVIRQASLGRTPVELQCELIQ